VCRVQATQQTMDTASMLPVFLVDAGTLEATTEDNLAVNIVDAGTSLRFATLALRSCYSVNASSVPAFVHFRGQVTLNACVYKDRVLPLAEFSLQSVKTFFDFFG